MLDGLDVPIVSRDLVSDIELQLDLVKAALHHPSQVINLTRHLCNVAFEFFGLCVERLVQVLFGELGHVVEGLGL